MALEIERKFLVVNNNWRSEVKGSRHIVDHLIGQFEDGKARIRICDAEATLTIKGPRRGYSRSEYHVPLQTDVGSAIVSDFSKGPGLEKLRHEVRRPDAVWLIDEYLGALKGLITADVELTSEEQQLSLPDWAGNEITGDPRLSSAILAKANIDDNSASQLLTLYAAGP